jgi:DNA processing protein
VRHAIEQNREIFTVSGSVDRLASRDCHRLIRDGARLVERVHNILGDQALLGGEIHTAPDEPPVRHPAELTLSDHERSLLGQLDNTPVGVDELIARTGVTASQVMATLTVLELRRLVRRLPGHQFVRA